MKEDYTQLFWPSDAEKLDQFVQNKKAEEKKRKQLAKQMKLSF